MTTNHSPGPALTDEPASGPAATRLELLASAKRKLVPIRHGFVQRPNTHKVRASILANLVRARQERALDAFLLLLALEPVLNDSPLPNPVWARLLSSGTGRAISAPAMSKTWHTLEKFDLAERDGRIRRLTNVQPLREDGSRTSYTRPGSDATVGKGWFHLPHQYWLEDWHEKLSLPGCRRQVKTDHRAANES